MCMKIVGKTDSGLFAGSQSTKNVIDLFKEQRPFYVDQIINQFSNSQLEKTILTTYSQHDTNTQNLTENELHFADIKHETYTRR